jgi:hypothetical protein
MTVDYNKMVAVITAAYFSHTQNIFCTMFKVRLRFRVNIDMGNCCVTFFGNSFEHAVYFQIAYIS